MPIATIAAERTWFAIAPDGAEYDVVLQVSVPTQQPDGGWSVSVSLGALESDKRNIFGEDSWQAISLGMRFAAMRANDFADNGWKFYWERGGDPASSADIANYE